MKTDRLTAVLLAALLLLTAFSPSPAHADYYEGYTFSFDIFGNIVITGYDGNQSEVNVKIDYKRQIFLLGDVVVPVTGIGPWAFATLTGLTSITLPDSLKNIGSSAFSQCRNLTTVMLPEGLEHIGDWAFSSCDSLTGLILPEGLKSIGKEAFSCAGSLGSLKLPDSLTSIGSNPFVRVPVDLIVSPEHPLLEVRDGVLFWKSNKQLITYPFDSVASAYAVPDGTSSIGDKAFFACDSLQTVTLPASVTAIGKDAFALCHGLILRVDRGSYAAAWAGENAMPCEYSDSPGVPAILPTPTPALTPFVRAEAQSVTYIPEDFPNIFSEEVLQYKEYKIDPFSFSYAIVLFNGRKIVSPVVMTNNTKAYDRFTDDNPHMCSIGGVEDNKLMFPITKGFFDSKDIVEIINLVEIDVLFYILNLDINDSKFSKLKASSMGKEELTVGEFIEIFKLMVPREMLPIKLERPEVNINPTIPRFKDDFLNKTINFRDLLFNMIIDKKTKLRTYLDFLRYENGIIYSAFSNQYEFEFMDDKEEIKYYSRHDYKKNNHYFISAIGNKKGLVEFFGEYFPLLSEPLANCETYGDLLEVYQMLPLEVQRKYKDSDFKDNPYVDPSWWVERPYAELSVGSSGQEVLDMKQRFYELGYFRTDKYNDQYSQNTADTVRLFEQNNSLPVDGVADAVMLGVLFSDKAVPKR